MIKTYYKRQVYINFRQWVTGGGVGCKLVQFVVYCVFLSWCQLTFKKYSAVSEEERVLKAYGFYLIVSLASMQIKSFWNPFSEMKLRT